MIIAVQVGAPADLAALLVTEQGTVRTDADFIFYNQPEGPGVRVNPVVGGRSGTVALSLSRVPAGIASIRAVVVLEGNATFGTLAAPTVSITEPNGNRLYDFRIDGLVSQSVVIAIEVYRRQGAWKVRAVGDGYAGGFAALVADHGVSVADAPARPVAAQPSYPAQPAYPAQQPYPSPQPTYSAPQGASQPYQPVAPPTYAPAPPPQQPAEVSLAKGRPVSLAKGQRVTLRKEGGVVLTYIRMGLGWDPVTRGGLFGRRPIEIDLDASVAMYADNSLVDVVYYGQLTSKDGAIRHQGDNLTGEGDGDDEVILVDLTRVPAHVTTLLFFVTSYQGHTFQQVTNAFCRLIDGTNNAELARYSLTGGMPFTAISMAKVFRSSGDWKLQAIGEPFNAKHPGEAVPQLTRFVAN
ncbi:TerD family protein [Nocardia camponoti]|uniref:Transport-associated protein n=1 Tax=Nocardia camponoti TaxID=1616106 RepID=A0A917V9T6_9NOCA|nr:TerD family protein [Nocardia camponoti]GGK53953.1 transport-associated protein [Nocardia camponoti]